MRFEIARSLNGNKVMYIARDTSGVVRLREETEEGILDAIKDYNESLAKQAELKLNPKKESASDTKKQTTKSKPETIAPHEIEVSTKEPTTPPATSAPSSPPPIDARQPAENEKKFLTNDIKTQIEEKRKRSGKQSFWDKLK